MTSHRGSRVHFLPHPIPSSPCSPSLLNGGYAATGASWLPSASPPPLREIDPLGLTRLASRLLQCDGNAARRVKRAAKGSRTRRGSSHTCAPSHRPRLSTTLPSHPCYTRLHLRLRTGYVAAIISSESRYPPVPEERRGERCSGEVEGVWMGAGHGFHHIWRRGGQQQQQQPRS